MFTIIMVFTSLLNLSRYVSFFKKTNSTIKNIPEYQDDDKIYNVLPVKAKLNAGTFKIETTSTC